MSATVPTPRAAASSKAPEIATEDHHEAIRRSWELPAYERPAPPDEPPVQNAQSSHRTQLVGLACCAVCLAAGIGIGYGMSATRSESPSTGTAAIPMVPGTSITHDSRVLEVPQTIQFGRDTRPVTQ